MFSAVSITPTDILYEIIELHSVTAIHIQ